MALSIRLLTRALLAASDALCARVTRMLGAHCLRKRRVEGATRDGRSHPPRLRSAVLPF